RGVAQHLGVGVGREELDLGQGRREVHRVLPRAARDLEDSAAWREDLLQDLEDGAFVAFGGGRGGGLDRRWTRTRVGRSSGSTKIASQPGGRTGRVSSKTRRASLGERFTQPWLRGRPKSSCQNAACRAIAPSKNCTQGTFSMK